MRGLAWMGLIVWRFRVSFFFFFCLFFCVFLFRTLFGAIDFIAFLRFEKKKRGLNLGLTSWNTYTYVTAAALLFAVDIIGQCPPQEYKPEALPNHGIRTNPYWFFYGPGKSYTESSSSLDDGNDEESFAPIDAGASNSAIILGLGKSSFIITPDWYITWRGPGILILGIGTLAEIGATSSIDDHPGVLSLMDSSNNNIFDLSDNVTPLLLSSDGGSNNNNNNAPDNMYSTGSSFISNNLQEGGQEDYSSLFA